MLLAALACTLLASAVSAQRITGISPERAAKLPGVRALFTVDDASAPPRIERGREVILGEVVARFLLPLTDGDVEREAILAGAHEVTRMSPLGLFLLRGRPTVSATEAMMKRLWDTDVVVSMSPNYIGELAFQPNDPHSQNGLQWYIEAPSDIDLDLSAAWDITRGSSDVVVAFVDSGTRLDHPEFSNRFFVNEGEVPGNGLDDDNNGYTDDVNGWNVTTGNGGPNEDVKDILGHGTWVSSILAANSNNFHQVAGVDHFTRLLPVKVGTFSIAENWFVAGLDYLVDNPTFADVIHFSINNFFASGLSTTALNALAETAILVASAGNDGGPFGADSGHPESHPAVLTIAGTDQFDQIYSGSDGGNSIDFAAPAVDIVSASWCDPEDCTVESDPFNPQAYHVASGTSFAAPMVSGIASLALSLKPDLSRYELEVALRGSSVDLGAPGKDTEFGWGRVNAHQALIVLGSILFADGFEDGNTSAWALSSP